MFVPYNISIDMTKRSPSSLCCAWWYWCTRSLWQLHV